MKNTDSRLVQQGGQNHLCSAYSTSAFINDQTLSLLLPLWIINIVDITVRYLFPNRQQHRHQGAEAERQKTPLRPLVTLSIFPNKDCFTAQPIVSFNNLFICVSRFSYVSLRSCVIRDEFTQSLEFSDIHPPSSPSLVFLTAPWVLKIIHNRSGLHSHTEMTIRAGGRADQSLWVPSQSKCG